MSKFSVSLDLVKKFNTLFHSKCPYSSSTSSSNEKNKGGKKKSSAIGVFPLAVKASKSKSKPFTLPESVKEQSTQAPKTSNAKKKKKPNFHNADDNGLPLLSSKDCFRRVEFASKMLEIIQNDSGVLDSLLFSDEGNFYLTKKPKNLQGDPKDSQNKSNKRISGESKPLPQIVWCGMTSKSIVGPYFFNSHVTDRTYLKMLQTYLKPQLKRLETPPVGHWWYQQDGAPPHRSRSVLSYLTKEFGSSLISYGCPIAWPPKSQDLTPLDYFLWDNLKSGLESNFLPTEMCTRERFRKSLIRQIDETDETVLAKVIQQFPIRLEKCITSNGERFDLDL